jgi:hypothetical protein
MPGTPTARPEVDAASKLLPWNMVGVAAAGAFSRESIAKVRLLRAR